MKHDFAAIHTHDQYETFSLAEKEIQVSFFSRISIKVLSLTFQRTLVKISGAWSSVSK